MTEILPARHLDALPLSVVFLLTVVLLVAFGEIGFLIGRFWRKHRDTESFQTGAITGATLGLLAFMLAFSFGMASERFDARKEIVLEEANAIGTTWLRSQLLPERHAEPIEGLLLQYVDVRLAGGRTASTDVISRLIDESEELHEQLWSHAVTLGKEYPRSVVLGLFISSLNQLIDIHEARLNIARYRIPDSVLLTLYFIALTATTILGVHSGIAGVRTTFVTILLSMALASVMVLIIDLDRPGQRLFHVSLQALMDVRESISQ
jgi:hypothetical protein